LTSLLIIANETDQARSLSSEITRGGYACSVTPNDENTLERVTKQAPNLVLIDVDGLSVGSGFYELCRRIRQERHIPVIALIPREILDSFSLSIGTDDFVVKPWEATEVRVRIKRILGQANHSSGGEIIRCGDLVINTGKCQISLGDNLIMLTFREYQLLKFLVTNQGKVFTREALLDRVWGWDYYGGDRTVDVHIRRLRSKIEDRNHSFIETVRNIGYRCKEKT
jgi:DNA-binding response OmpR family regulator